MKKLIDCLKVGDKVFDIRFGWGIVESLNGYRCDFPIIACFQKIYTVTYTENGFDIIDAVNPSLFLYEVTLKQELPEFIEGEIVCVLWKGSDFEHWVIGTYKSKTPLGQHLVAINPNDLEDIYFFDKVKSFDKSHFAK